MHTTKFQCHTCIERIQKEISRNEWLIVLLSVFGFGIVYFSAGTQVPQKPTTKTILKYERMRKSIDIWWNVESYYAHKYRVVIVSCPVSKFPPNNLYTLLQHYFFFTRCFWFPIFDHNEWQRLLFLFLSWTIQSKCGIYTSLLPNCY